MSSTLPLPLPTDFDRGFVAGVNRALALVFVLRAENPRWPLETCIARALFATHGRPKGGAS